VPNQTSLFVEVVAPPPSLIIVGGAHRHRLTSLAKTLGYTAVVGRAGPSGTPTLPRSRLVQAAGESIFTNQDHRRTAIAS
jgi:hypothetical protein